MKNVYKKLGHEGSEGVVHMKEQSVIMSCWVQYKYTNPEMVLMWLWSLDQILQTQTIPFSLGGPHMLGCGRVSLVQIEKKIEIELGMAIGS